MLEYQGGRAEAESLALTVPVVEELPVRTPEGAAKGEESRGEAEGGGLSSAVVIGAGVGLLVLGAVLGGAVPALLRRERGAVLAGEADQGEEERIHPFGTPSQ